MRRHKSRDLLTMRCDGDKMPGHRDSRQEIRTDTDFFPLSVPPPHIQRRRVLGARGQ